MPLTINEYRELFTIVPDTEEIVNRSIDLYNKSQIGMPKSLHPKRFERIFNMSDLIHYNEGSNKFKSEDELFRKLVFDPMFDKHNTVDWYVYANFWRHESGEYVIRLEEPQR